MVGLGAATGTALWVCLCRTDLWSVSVSSRTAEGQEFPFASRFGLCPFQIIDKVVTADKEIGFRSEERRCLPNP